MKRSTSITIANGVVFLIAVIGSLLGQQKAASAEDFTFGVGTHFAFSLKRGYVPATQRPLLKSLGVGSFRDDVDADVFIEPSAAEPLGSRLDRLSEMVRDDNHRPILILRGARLEGDPKPRYVPRTAAEADRFASYAADVVRATEAHQPLYEIWNEWNMMWRERPRLGGLLASAENPDFSPENYVDVARSVYRSIKATRPSATVLTGAIGDDDGWTWTRRALKAGLARTGDAISVHLYNHCNSSDARTAENLIEKAEDFRRVVSDETGGQPPPIYITEFGWPNDKGNCGIPLELAAANLAQFSLWASATDWLGGVWVYELRDSGQDAMEREDNFGLYTYDNRPKPGACAYREAISLSREMKNKRFRDAPDGIRWLEGTDSDGQTIWAIWTTGRDASGTIELEGGESRPMRTFCSPDKEATMTATAIGPLPLVVRAGVAAEAAKPRLQTNGN